MIDSQSSGGLHDTDADHGGADAVPDTPGAPNPGTPGPLVRKGVADEIDRGRSTGLGAGISVASFAALLAVVALVLLVIFGGFSMAPPGR